VTIGPRSQCAACKNLVAELNNWHCTAFPTGIPEIVVNNGRDHREPIDGDRGVRFEAKPGDEFPDWAFLPRFLGVGGSLTS